MSTIPEPTPTSWGLTRTLPGIPYSDAIAATKAALAAEGFGVLTEIDMKATLKAKLGVDVRDTIILGACNPPIAYEVMQKEPGVALLLPCNVVVSSDDDGNAVVSAIDPVAMFSVVDRDDIAPLALEVKARLTRALDALGGVP